MKQELMNHLNQVEQLVQRNYIVLDIMKNLYENSKDDFESSQKILIILKDMIEQQKSVLNGLNTFITSLKEQNNIY